MSLLLYLLLPFGATFGCYSVFVQLSLFPPKGPVNHLSHSNLKAADIYLTIVRTFSPNLADCVLKTLCWHTVGPSD